MSQKAERIIAVDFDGTIVDHEFPYIGNLKPGAKRVLNKWAEEGISVIIWTCRQQVDRELGGQADTFAVRKFLDDNGIMYDAVNEQSPKIPFRLHCAKVFADLYIDDRNMGGFPGWTFTEKAVESFYKTGDWRNTFLQYEEASLFEKE